MMGLGATTEFFVGSSRRRRNTFANPPPPSPTSLRIKLRRVERLRRSKETGALPRISLQTLAQILIHLPSHSRENG
jgi:hypothetical protein